MSPVESILKNRRGQGSSPCFILSSRLFQVKSELKFILQNGVLVDFYLMKLFWFIGVYRISTISFLPLVVNVILPQCTEVLDNWSVLSLQSTGEQKSVNKYKMCQCVFHHLVSSDCLTAGWVLSCVYSHLVVSDGDSVAFLSSHEGSCTSQPVLLGGSLELTAGWNLRLDAAVYGGGMSQCRCCFLLFQTTLLFPLLVYLY